jgi:hypothetical protein
LLLKLDAAEEFLSLGLVLEAADLDFVLFLPLGLFLPFDLGLDLEGLSNCGACFDDLAED